MARKMYDDAIIEYRAAVISDPDRSAASTTIVSEHSPAMMRLRAGKHQRCATLPGGISDITACVATSSRYRRRLLGGYGV